MKISTLDVHVPDPELYPELQGDSEGFELSTIRDEDASLAVELLIGNYSAPLDAVIRELTVNAIDAHRDAGQHSPVEIAMPTSEHPAFVVRDTGLGLSPTDMVTVYTRPAASTKRGENTSTGGLGIGAKSPFTIVNRFVVTGVKGGVVATLVMARIDGQLKHRVQDIRAARPDEQTSVTVTVPVDPSPASIESWWKALSRVHFWWDQGLVTITNQDQSPVALPSWQERLLAPDAVLPEEQSIVFSPSLKSATVLMGQIGYQIPEGVAPTHLPLVYRAPVGALRIAPTREAILDSPENRAVLKRMLDDWRETQFAHLADEIVDPQTSIWSQVLVYIQLIDANLEQHFLEWTQQKRADQIAERLLPRHGLQQLLGRATNGSSSTPSRRMQITPYGVPDDSAARSEPLAAALHKRLSFRELPVVFVDSRTLPDARRRVLTKWARREQVIAMFVDRVELEDWRFDRFLEWTKHPELTRPFADPEQLEWIDPADIQVTRAPKKPAQAVHMDSTLEIIEMHDRWRRSTLTVRELVERVKGKRNRWAIVDRQSALKELPGALPESIVVVPSGQHPVKLLREQLDKQAITVEQFTKNQVDIVMRATTRAQRTWAADYELARISGVDRYFRPNAGWIAETRDPAVRAVAEEIQQIVQEVRAVPYDRAKRTKAQHGVDYRDALRTMLQDEQWLIANSRLGKYALVLVAATASTLGRWPSVVDRSSVVELIRSTIAAVLAGQS